MRTCNFTSTRSRLNWATTKNHQRITNKISLNYKLRTAALGAFFAAVAMETRARSMSIFR